MNKKGQFFLIAALVIIGIILGLATRYNTVKVSEEDRTVYDLSNEILFEATQVIDNGIFKEIDEGTISDRIENLTDFYSNRNPDSDIIVVYGNKRSLTVIFYNKTETGSIGITIGNPVVFQTFTKDKLKRDGLTGEDVTVDLGLETTYDFTLRPGQVFYIIIKKEKSGERFVSAPETQ